MISSFAIKSCTNSLLYHHYSLLSPLLISCHTPLSVFPIQTKNLPSFSSLKNISFTHLLSNNSNRHQYYTNMTMGDYNSNWGTSEYNHHQLGLDVPKFKSVQPPSLPLSSSPPSPSSYLPFSSAFSPSEFFNSSLFLPSPNVSYKLSHANNLLWFGFITNCGGFLWCYVCGFRFLHLLLLRLWLRRPSTGGAVQEKNSNSVTKRMRKTTRTSLSKPKFNLPQACFKW